jgi:long-chain acyl-CoA synthetase
MAKLPDTRQYSSLSALADACLRTAADRPMLVAETDTGIDSWTGADLLRRSRYATVRLLEAGMVKGDLALIWAPSGPETVAAFLAAYRAGIIPVPLDLRMTSEIVDRIAARAGTRWLIAGDGAPLETAPGAEPYRRIDLQELTRDESADMPAGWEARLEQLPQLERKDLFLILYTSGTTGQPRGVMISNGNWLEPWERGLSNPLIRLYLRYRLRHGYRTISLMPMSHLMGLGEASGALMFGGTVVYPRGRSPRALLEAIRTHQVSTISGAPRFLELFWRQLTREIDEQGGTEDFERRRASAARKPYFIRRRIFKRELEMLGGKVQSISSAAAFLPPDLQAAWESIGLPVFQGYGATECGAVASTSLFRHPVGKVGKPAKAARVELAPDGEILVSGPQVTAGYWRDPEATSQAWDDRGRYHTGDIGRFDEKGNLVLLGRKKNVIVLSNGLNVYPEDIETALHEAGLGDTVVVETLPGRIEAVILDPERELAAMAIPSDASVADRREALRDRIDAAVRQANSRLTVHERIDAWRLWPDADFPRTHTQKIQRDPVREWAAAPNSVPLQIREGVAAEA